MLVFTSQHVEQIKKAVWDELNKSDTVLEDCESSCIMCCSVCLCVCVSVCVRVRVCVRLHCFSHFTHPPLIKSTYVREGETPPFGF